jgi:hypothetical protein
MEEDSHDYAGPILTIIVWLAIVIASLQVLFDIWF